MKNLREIIAATTAVLIIFLSGCSNLNYARFLFIDAETKKELKNLQEITKNAEASPDYYSEKYRYHPTSTD